MPAPPPVGPEIHSVCAPAADEFETVTLFVPWKYIVPDELEKVVPDVFPVFVIPRATPPPPAPPIMEMVPEAPLID
jgi:hypothetical protein